MGQVIKFTPALAKEYRELFEKAVIRPTWAKAVSDAVAKMLAGREQYEKVAAKFGCPWVLIAAIHMMEGSCNFKTHLHNGDSLKARTVTEPVGRPKTGSPPFSWYDSAIDAIQMKGWGAIDRWTLERALFELERYNGFGYRLYHPTVLSPYLWSGTTLYSKGKYVADRKWSDTAVSKQVGVMALLVGLANEDPELSLSNLLPFEDEAGVPVGHEEENVVLFVQKRLKELGYHEVGNIDGKIGGKTKTAILAFRMDNDIPGDPVIDDELLTALAKAAPRPLSAARVTATAKDLSDKPAVAAAGQSKIISLITGFGATLYGVFQGVVSNISGAKDFLSPVKDLVGSVPTEVWVVMVAGVALAVYLNSRKAETQVVAAYREGSLQ